MDSEKKITVKVKTIVVSEDKKIIIIPEESQINPSAKINWVLKD